MSKLPEGRKPLPNEWFVDRANRVIREMTDEERQRAKERAKANRTPYSENKCVSCGNVAATDFCEFCLKEE
jgi:recombinational DNA repair protein RecR